MHTKAFGEYISDSKVPVNVYVAKRIKAKDLAWVLCHEWKEVIWSCAGLAKI